MAVTREGVLEALKQITDPVSGSDIVAAGVVRALHIEGTEARFVLEIPYQNSIVIWPIGCGGGIAIVMLAGWLATRRITQLPPLRILTADS